MPRTSNRTAEIRLIVIVVVDIDDEELLDAVAGGKPVAEIVRSEVVSNLESVSYVNTAIVSQL